MRYLVNDWRILSRFCWVKLERLHLGLEISAHLKELVAVLLLLACTGLWGQEDTNPLPSDYQVDIKVYRVQMRCSVTMQYHDAHGKPFTEKIEWSADFKFEVPISWEDALTLLRDSHCYQAEEQGSTLPRYQPLQDLDTWCKGIAAIGFGGENGWQFWYPEGLDLFDQAGFCLCGVRRDGI